MTHGDMIRNARFFNRTVGIGKAIIEGIAFAAIAFAFAAVCSIA